MIHVDFVKGASGRASQLRWFLASVLRRARRDEPAPLRVRIDDLRGRPVLAIEDSAPLLDLPLPAGTYHVSACLGAVRRSYTLTLAPGGRFELHLRLPAQDA